jgi:hypothetical protein
MQKVVLQGAGKSTSMMKILQVLDGSSFLVLCEVLLKMKFLVDLIVPFSIN